MDEFSQNVNKNGENNLNSSESNDSVTEDISFEDNFDIDNILKVLQENPEIEDVKKDTLVPPPPPVQQKDPSAKKYVIYVNPDNIDFMESLSIPERREVINKVLKEQNEVCIAKKKLEEKKNKIINTVLATMTILISTPLIFTIVNKVTDITILNYHQAKENFSTLYKQEGKIKRSDFHSGRTIKY